MFHGSPSQRAMSEASTEGRKVSATQVVFRAVVPILLLAVLACIALTVFDLESLVEVYGFAGSVVLVFFIQMAAVWRRCSRLNALITDNSGDTDDILRTFPVSMTLQVAAAAALVGPIAFITASSILGLGPEKLLLKSIAAFLITEGALLIPVFFAVRNSMQLLVPSHLSCRRHRDSLVVTLLLIIIIPAVFAAFGLFVESDRIVRKFSNHWTMECYRQAAEAAFISETSPIDITTLSYLTHFDRATPFGFRADTGAQYGIDSSDLRVLSKDRTRRSSGAAIDEEKGWGLVWVPIDGEETVGGFRVSLSETSNFYYIIASLLCAAALAGIALSIRQNTRLKEHYDYLTGRFDMLPDQTMTQAQPNLPEEVRAVDHGLSQLKERFYDMRKATDEAIESCRATRDTKSQFFAGISHDLRSPLNSIIGFTDLLLKGMEGPLTEDQTHVVLLIAEESKELMVLIADILDTSKLEAGSFDLDRMWVPSVEVLTECTSEARRFIGTRPIELVSSLQPGLPPVRIDKARVRQAIVSLLVRAISTIKQGTVRLKASLERPEGRGSRRLRVDIIDPNRVIPQNERDRMKAAFYSIEGTTSRSISGGLGLSISLARNVVTLHGGELAVMSDKSGGAIFSIVLPLDEPTQTE
ncbi:MAG: HAMP domain-containing histidine kinase [Proteobacteria bacterium]|nr:HAMP domain-containing histidine kinase [Pseudomonadota bacterium]